nr:endonuclease [uncultured Carboxylicivirga sp.]
MKNFKRLYSNLLTLLFLCYSGLVFAQIPTGYYSSAEGKSGYELKTALFNIIKGHTEQSYNSLWTHFKTTDKKADGTVWDMYSDVPGGSPSYVYTFGNDQCGQYSGEGSCYNREHSFPKSWFHEGKPMYSDLFHLYPTDGYVNGRRSNYPFGEVSSPTWTSTNGCKLGKNSTEGYSSTVFEPIDEYKGDFARSYFYMATRYENVISTWVNYGSSSELLDGSSDKVFKDWQLNLLIKWNNEDPVSEKEINRNNAIFDIQDNRNPFIDHPEYVTAIWNGSPSVPSTKTSLLFEDFESYSTDQNLSIANWLNSSEEGTVVWQCADYNSNQYAQFKSYQQGEDSNKGWLVTKNIPLSQYQNGELTFSTSGGYDNGATLEAYVITNYETGTEPWEASLTPINFNLPNIPSNSYANQWTSSGIIDLSSYSEDIRIAFKYTGGDNINQTTTWQLDNINVTAETKATGINDNFSLDYKLYPNPNNGNFYIEGDFKNSNIQIMVYNNIGQLVYNKNKSNFNRTDINLTNLSKGIYFLKIEAKNKQFKTKKVILH